ncbi:hypothetical protein [Litorimonas sp.]|uniref:hypothetical protein n=1 Tax=Litorimonas sp. TaxID=1892381 RepID=UPI003A87994C
MDWTVFAGALIGSGVASVFTGWILTNWTAKKQKEEKGKFLSNKLAVKFERYAIVLANSLNDDLLYEDTYGSPYPEQGAPLMRIPTPPEIVLEPTYEFFKADLRDRVMQFEDDIAVTNLRLASASDVLDGEEVNKFAVEDCKRIGKMAIELSIDLRENYNLAKRSLSFGQWSVSNEFD